MPQRDPLKERIWRRLLREWRQSGLTGREFCLRQGITEPSFYAWRREIARRDRLRSVASIEGSKPPPRLADAVRAPRQSRSPAAPPFLKLAINNGPAKTPPIEVVVATGRLLRVHPGFDPHLLRQLLCVLEAPSC